MKKRLKTLAGPPVLSKYTGILIYDHETALYHFGTGHGERNVHLDRYLYKNTEETLNRWSHDMEMFLKGLTYARKELNHSGISAFELEQLKRFSHHYDELIAMGYEANQSIPGKTSEKGREKLLNWIVKYKKKHLLFLYDFSVHYSNI